MKLQKLLHSIDEGIEICPFHSLVFNIGLSQRKRDSILSLPRDDEDATMRTGNTVTQIARLDGNSVGWIFTRPGLNQTPDSRRRRCFRYNAHWWISLARSFGSISAVDSVGAWVTGGDDVLLAQYGEGDHLEKMLIGVCGNLDQSLNREMAEDPDGPLCTVTIAHVKDGENIKHMLDSSAELEFQAKKAWKIAAGNWNRKMIDSTKIPSDSPDVQGAFVDSSIDPEVKHFVSIEVKPMFSTQYLDESDAIIVDDWPGEWSEEFENKVLAMATKMGGNWEFLVSSMEDETKYRNLSRSHVVYSDDGVDQLRILPPKGE